MYFALLNSNLDYKHDCTVSGNSLM